MTRRVWIPVVLLVVAGLIVCRTADVSWAATRYQVTVSVKIAAQNQSGEAWDSNPLSRGPDPYGRVSFGPATYHITPRKDEFSFKQTFQAYLSPGDRILIELFDGDRINDDFICKNLLTFNGEPELRVDTGFSVVIFTFTPAAD